MKGEVTTCGNPNCNTVFRKRSALHTYCCMACRKAARGSHWRAIRKEALVRDGFACTSCGKQGCRLEAHHIVPVCVDGTSDLDNLTILCVHCHKAAHRSWNAYFKIVDRKKAA